MYEKIVQNVLDKKIVAIVRGAKPEHILALGEALYAGGINMMEVTFDQTSTDNYKATTDSIKLLVEKLGDKMYIGAGTVMSPAQVDLCIEAGGQFIVTPNTDPEVISYAHSKGLVTMPGALSPSEAQIAHKAGADFVKIFPVGNLGAGYIKAIKAPLKHIKLLAVGGVNEKNVAEFLAAGCVGAGCGGNLVNMKWIEAGEFDKITALAKEFAEAVQSV